MLFYFSSFTAAASNTTTATTANIITTFTITTTYTPIKSNASTVVADATSATTCMCYYISYYYFAYFVFALYLNVFYRIEKCKIGAAEIPDSVTVLMECPKPNPKPKSPLYPTFGQFQDNELPITVRTQDFAWILAQNLSRTPEVQVKQEPVKNEDRPSVTGQEEPVTGTRLPVWSGYNSLINKTMPIIRIGAPPLIAAPAHEWQKLLTVLMQAQQISTKVVRSERKTVISLDMGLYQQLRSDRCLDLI